MPKRNSSLIGNGGRATDDPARLEIGEEQVQRWARAETRFHVRASIVRPDAL